MNFDRFFLPDIHKKDGTGNRGKKNLTENFIRGMGIC